MRSPSMYIRTTWWVTGALPLAGKVLIGVNVGMWGLVGVTISWRLQIAQAFNRVGLVIPIDVEQPEQLRPFAANVLDDVLVIVVA